MKAQFIISNIKTYYYENGECKSVNLNNGQVYDISLLKVENSLDSIVDGDDMFLGRFFVIIDVPDVGKIKTIYYNLHDFLKSWDILYDELDHKMYRIHQLFNDGSSKIYNSYFNELNIVIKIAKNTRKNLIAIQIVNDALDRVISKILTLSEYNPDLPNIDLEEEPLSELIKEAKHLEPGQSVTISLDEYKEVYQSLVNKSNYRYFHNDNFDAIYTNQYIYLNVKDTTGKTYGIQKKLKRYETCMYEDLNDISAFDQLLTQTMKELEEMK